MGFERQRRVVSEPSSLSDIDIQSTTGDITQSPLGVTALATTTTGVPILVTLNPPRAGYRKTFMLDNTGATSNGFHINTSSSGTVFNNDGDNMVTLATDESSIQLIGQTSSRWSILGGNGFSLSTST